MDWTVCVSALHRPSSTRFVANNCTSPERRLPGLDTPAACIASDLSPMQGSLFAVQLKIVPSAAEHLRIEALYHAKALRMLGFENRRCISNACSAVASSSGQH